MKNLRSTQAAHAFKKGHYHTARNLYRSLAAELGEHLFANIIELCNRAERARFLNQRAPRSGSPGFQEEHITYCVPIFNRLGDLKKTLLHNLDVLSQFRHVKLIVNLFDRDDEAYLWITQAGAVYLDAGLLSVNQMPPLKTWHFPRAKNSFANLVQTGFYSSLDGDNYLTVEEVVRTKQAMAEFGPCIIHHFSGTWGDGTCGRVTLPARLYREGGYNNNLFPRQFDEFSLILNALNIEPASPLVVREGVEIFRKSHYMGLLKDVDGWVDTSLQCNLGAEITPENPKVTNYTQKSAVLRLFGKINGYYSLTRVARTEAGKWRFHQQLQIELRKAESSDVLPALAEYVFNHQRKTLPQAPTAQNTRVALVKRCDLRALAWIARQRSEGVSQFLVVEFGEPVTGTSPILGKDVIVLRPEVGDELSFSGFWLRCLKALYNIPHTLQTPHLSFAQLANQCEA
ncbi:hypothetical protein [Marinimicrobium agarilyticum]|uniref:hypothetical protein n=1 Tax=Marinimicrobium agarilyticum TaxID=306546 RepID=UPI00040ED3BE|nr:hypothetical protein [Marinimicrobium agarilyticum]